MMDRYKLKFIKEARTLAQFKHPNIVRIFDIFEENDTTLSWLTDKYKRTKYKYKTP